MRLSRTAILSKQRRNQKVIRVKQKHKRLDAICEKTYTQNRDRIESPKPSEVNGDTSEVRRSSRVRRAPLVLDASPPPAKKRRTIRERRGGERDSTTLRLEEEESGEWKSRLRARGRKVSFTTESSSPTSKKKLFANSNGVKEHSDQVDSQLDDKKEGLVGETLMVVQSKRPGRIKASNVVSNGQEEIGLGNSDKDEEETSVHVVKDKNKVCLDNGAAIELLEQGNEVPVISDSKDNTNNMEQSAEQSKPVEQPESEERENQSLHQEATCAPENHIGDGAFLSPNHRQRKPRIKKGRCCDLCGGGTDGKPPRKLVHDGANSDNEAYSGSSSSDEPTYDIWDEFGDEPGWLGQLLGPINDRFGIAGIWVHQQCAVWSPEVYFAGLGCLKNVRSALCRGRVLKCSRCERRGATIGCRVDRCPKTYHLPCARAIGCIFDHRKFLIACTDHRHLFQPHGSNYFDRLKKIKTKKMKLQLRKHSNDAWRKDHEAEEKWLENCGEDDEFLKRESKRLQRDLSRIAPVYIGGSSQENSIPFQGWESVGGLQDVIQSLKEVVILPLLYPEFFNNIGLTPPRGVLLHGYPGTGKTLVVRSLIGSCARGDKRIAYFARKGADCLGKYVGDAERQLRLLFQVAEKSQPSIIFFDEIDGLAPSRTRQQDQTHNSVVSTLLALLDGLKSRGSVVVIGATNRPDAIDPALRRPGRFDREIYFPLPSVKDREAILTLHTKKWPTPVTGDLLKMIAEKTIGFAGADLQALCTQTAIIALKRSSQWDKVLSMAEEKGPSGQRPVLPSFSVRERDWLEALSCAPPPCSRREAGMAANDIVTSVLPVHLLPCMLGPVSRLVFSLCLDERVTLPPSLSKAAAVMKTVIVSHLERKGKKSDCWWEEVEGLIEDADVASDVELSLVRANVLVGNGVSSKDDEVVMKSGSFKGQNGYLGKSSGFCMLISGSPKSGQRHLASCVLQSFVGSAVLQKVDLATMLQEGAGDMVQGLTQILVRCAGVGSCMIFMPRIDLWALQTWHQVDVEENCFSSKNIESSCPIQENDSSPKLFKSSHNMGKTQDSVLKASDLWSSFVEQAESIFISTSLMILATSEVPFESLPPRIKDFFGKTKPDLTPSNHTKTTIPRFSVNLTGNFNRDTIINSSATKLSNDISRYFLDLIHQKTHNTDVDTTTPLEEYNPKTLNPNPSPPITKKEEKGKSNLALAISTFGYQILQYPHFAELCWVTSKLKDGPFAEIDGPLKGWPFNSCIIRPSAAATSATLVGSGSGNLKSKEKFGLVRGLIAVGLSAYRGVYSSIREVSADVRKVLEVLTNRISAKVEGGKDRRQFARVLSQVAYLEDLVNSWAYTLQSLETSQPLEPIHKPSHSESLKETSEGFDEILKETDKNIDHATCIVDESSQVIIETQESTTLLKDPNGILPELSNSLNHSEIHSNGFAHPDQSTTIKPSPDQDSKPSSYRFCSKCMSNLQTAIEKNLVSEWDRKTGDWTTEDVHDVVTSVSVNLHKWVREFCLNRDEVAAKECGCDSGCGFVGEELIYRKGVVVGVLESDVSFECKFETLCLCSLIEYIVMTKQEISG